MSSRRHRRDAPVQRVTDAPISLHDDQAERIHRYLFSMGVRTACFILAVIFIAVLHWTIIGWVCVGAAVVLPYIAVVMANATRSRRIDRLGAVTPTGQPLRELKHDPHDTPHGSGA